MNQAVRRTWSISMLAKARQETQEKQTEQGNPMDNDRDDQNNDVRNLKRITRNIMKKGQRRRSDKICDEGSFEYRTRM